MAELEFHIRPAEHTPAAIANPYELFHIIRNNLPGDFLPAHLAEHDRLRVRSFPQLALLPLHEEGVHLAVFETTARSCPYGYARSGGQP